MATRTLQIVLAGDSASATREFRKVEQGAGRMGKSLDREGRRVSGFASLTSKGFSRVGVASSAMSAVAGGAFVLMAKNAVTSATSINESLTKNEVLFGKHAGSVERFSQSTARSLGISRQAALEATGTFGNLFVALEVGPRKSAQMSVALTRLAADLASFNNASPEEALEAIRSGLVGETEPLRRFGVNLNDATLRAEALRMGLVRNTKEALEPQTRALAVNSLLFEQTKKAQGDFARTSDGLANQQRILKARLSDTAAELGSRLMPFALRAVSALNDLITETQNGRGPLIRLKNAVEGVVGEVRGAVNWFRRHKTTTDILISAVVGLTTAFVAYKIAVIAATVAIRALVAAAILLNIAMRANPIGIVVTAVIALGAAMVTAYKRSETFRKIVDGAWDGIKSAARSAWNVIKPVFKGIRDGAEAVAKAVGKVAAVFGTVGGAVNDAAGFLNPFGDGLGKTARNIASIPAFGGGLMGARPEMAPIAGMAQRFGLRVSSGKFGRENTLTSSGNRSWHATGEAIDVAGPASGMMGFARFMSKRAGSLAELIYTPLGAWSNGSRYTPTGKLAADHYDHVHVAMDVGAPGQGDGIGRTVQAARSVGLKGKMLETMVAIAGAESGYNARINAAGPEDSRGLWQINVGPGANTDMLRLGNLYDPMVNAKAMKIILGRQGLGAWSVYSSGKYRDYLSRARAAISSGAGGRGRADTPSRPLGPGGSVQGSGNTAGGVGNVYAKGGGGAGLGYEGQLAGNAIGRAKAENKDNLSGLIHALVGERIIKRRRLKLINKVLRGRISKARRTRLLQEKAQLISEIGDLTDTIKEYKADQAGGATTISRAEELEAGVDPNVPEPPPPPEPVADNSAAIADLTAAITRMTNFNEWMIRTQGPSIVNAVVAAVNGGIGGPVGLGLQGIRSTPGSVAGL